jgi:hypothetical protein
MTLEDKDILQFDAAIITGLLIFLGISFVTIPSPDNLSLSNGIPLDYLRLILGDLSRRFQLTAVLIAPFVISSLIVLTRGLLDEHSRIQNKLSDTSRKVAILSVVFGLANMILHLILVSYAYSRI